MLFRMTKERAKTTTKILLSSTKLKRDLRVQTVTKRYSEFHGFRPRKGDFKQI
jgi:hypothetical protein